MKEEKLVYLATLKFPGIGEIMGVHRSDKMMMSLSFNIAGHKIDFMPIRDYRDGWCDDGKVLEHTIRVIYEPCFPGMTKFTDQGGGG